MTSYICLFALFAELKLIFTQDMILRCNKAISTHKYVKKKNCRSPCLCDNVPRVASSDRSTTLFALHFMKLLEYEKAEGSRGPKHFWERNLVLTIKLTLVQQLVRRL